MGRYMQDPGSWMDGGVGQEAEERMGSSAGCLEFEVLGQGQPRANAGLHQPGPGGPAEPSPRWGTLCRRVWSGRALRRQEVDGARIPPFSPPPAQLSAGKRITMTTCVLRTPAGRGPSFHQQNAKNMCHWEAQAEQCPPPGFLVFFPRQGGSSGREPGQAVPFSA